MGCRCARGALWWRCVVNTIIACMPRTPHTSLGDDGLHMICSVIWKHGGWATHTCVIDPRYTNHAPPAARAWTRMLVLEYKLTD